WQPGRPLELGRWWDLDFSRTETQENAADLAEELRELLLDSVRIRTRADVPVGVYLSGGLDSSAITAMLRQVGTPHLEAFGIGFSDTRFDESDQQDLVAASLGVKL